MVPHSREGRQVQRFSISTLFLITSPARYEEAPSCTTPLRMGGVQFELSALPICNKARACFIASQPAISAKNFSVNTTSLMKIRARQCAAWPQDWKIIYCPPFSLILLIALTLFLHFEKM